MTQKEIVKEGVKLAENEMKEEEIKRIKIIVKTTLEILKQKEEQRQKLDEEIRILKRDLEDMKDGRIDRIKERQDIDPKAKEASIIIIKEKIIEKQVSVPWYIPWEIEIKPQYTPYVPPWWCTAADNLQITYTTTATNAVLTAASTLPENIQLTTNNSMVHMYTGGTYKLNDGSIKYL